MNKIKLVLSDLDGTLLPYHAGIPEETVCLINSLEEKNILFGICTGRSYMSAAPLLKDLRITAPLITANGAVLYKGSEILSLHSFLLRPLQPLVGLALSQGFTVLLLQNGMEKTILYHTDVDWNDTAEKLTVLSEGLNIRFHILFNELSSIETAYSVSTYFDRGCEITAKEVNKASALLEVCEFLGISANNVMAIGDNENDRALLSAAGLGVAVNNACDTVKSAAAYVCNSSYAQGVMEAINNFVLS